MQHYNDDINYFKPQPYLCTGPLSKGMELIMQLRAGILPLNAMTAKFGRQSASRQSARARAASPVILALNWEVKLSLLNTSCLTVLFTRHKGKSCGRS